MAQAATMGPPLSPRETRRSGRRSAPSVSASASKSPDSDQPPRDKPNTARTTAPSNNNRTKKPKQEDYDDPIDDRKQPPPSSTPPSASNNPNGSARTKKRSKEKDKHSTTDNQTDDATTNDDADKDPADEEEEQGITRCVCGSAEDDPDAGEFMVQCELCKVWQHGLCMGYTSEDQVHDEDYYCEQCKPELHTDLFKRLAKRSRQTSATARHNDGTVNSRVSRSHSPSTLLKANNTSKRRNTMNSRDAAFDESLKELMEATAAEAAAANETPPTKEPSAPPIEVTEVTKKRKRVDDDTNAKKRTRSASTASDHQEPPVAPAETLAPEKAATQSAKGPGGRNKRGGRKVAPIEVPSIEVEEPLPSASVKKAATNSRVKGGNGVKRPALPHSTSLGGSTTEPRELPTRRNQVGGTQGLTAAESRAYRNTHAYAVSQQTLFTSWNLPDYLSHLEEMLPTDTPQPLEVRSGGVMPGTTRGDEADRTMERGVKVKWPAKRMSVIDMNKRVRALVEWVGREQANALDRGRRREALERALKENMETETSGTTNTNAIGMQMVEDGSQESPSAIATLASQEVSDSAQQMSAQTMKMMEELMEELISFQERFGPGAKSRERAKA